MWSTVSTVINAPFNALFWLVHWLPPAWQVVVLAVPGALFALAIYKLVSNQDAIRDAKDKIVAYLLELRLFRDDLRVLLRAEGRVFASIGRYLGHSLLPMVVMLPVFLLVLIQIESRFAFRGLAPDEQALVTVGINSESLFRASRSNSMARAGCESRHLRCGRTRAARFIGEFMPLLPARTI